MRLFNSGKTEYNPQGLVLEIACGIWPAPESDVLLEPDIARGNTLRKEWPSRVVIQGDALNLPFRDNAFDYITCMHLIEHFDHDALQITCSEFPRVAPRGYIEVPSIYWELLHNCDKLFFDDHTGFNTHHRQYCFWYEGKLHMINKSDTWSNEHRILRELFRKILNRAVTGIYIDLFMIGFEWNAKIPIIEHDSLNTIPNEILDAIIKRVDEYATTNKRMSPEKQAALLYGRSLIKRLNPIRYLKNGISKILKVSI